MSASPPLPCRPGHQGARAAARLAVRAPRSGIRRAAERARLDPTRSGLWTARCPLGPAAVKKSEPGTAVARGKAAGHMTDDVLRLYGLAVRLAMAPRGGLQARPGRRNTPARSTMANPRRARWSRARPMASPRCAPPPRASFGLGAGAGGKALGRGFRSSGLQRERKAECPERAPKRAFVRRSLRARFSGRFHA